MMKRIFIALFSFALVSIVLINASAQSVSEINNSLYPINYNTDEYSENAELFASNSFDFLGVLVVALPFNDTDLQQTHTALLSVQNTVNKEFAEYLDYISFGNLPVKCIVPQLNGNGTADIVKSPHNRSYYEPYQTVFNPDGYPYAADGQNFSSQEGIKRYSQLLKHGLDNLDKTFLTVDNLDGNGDGLVDEIIFLYPSPNGSWANMLWPHMWNLKSAMGTYYSFSSSLKANLYSFCNYNVETSTVFHESMHVLGLDDMYHYLDSSIDVTGDLTLMSGDCLNISSIEREQLGFLQVPEIVFDSNNESYTLTLNPLGQALQNNAYKYKVPNTSSTLYFEYRTPDNSYENQNIDSGLVIWRYDSIGEEILGNRYGPPFFAYVLRPLANDSHFGDGISSAFISQNNMCTRAGYDTDNTPTAFCLDIPKYKLFKISASNPLLEGDKRVYVNSNYAVRLIDNVNAGISIFDVNENADGTLSFSIKKGTVDIVNDPQFSLAPDSYSSIKQLALSSNDNADIYYTLDGSCPDPDINQNAIKYTSPFELNGNVYVSAICVDKNGQKSDTVGGTFSCFAPDNSLPYYDGTGKSAVMYASNFNTLFITFDQYDTSDISGNLALLDVRSNTAVNYNAKALSGKTIVVRSTGYTQFIATQPTAKYKVKQIVGYNDKAGTILTEHGLYDTTLQQTNRLIDGNTYYLYNYIYDFYGETIDIITYYAFYNSQGELIDVKSVEDKIYNAYKYYTIGCKFTYSDDLALIKSIIFKKNANDYQPLSRIAIPFYCSRYK